MNRFSFRFEYAVLPLSAWLLFGACREFYHVAWGTGTWLGEFSLKWGILFFAFVAFCVAIFLFAANPLSLWERARLRGIALRARGKYLRYPLALLALIFPVWFFQYTLWGIVFQGMYIRTLVWALVALLFAALVSAEKELVGWKEFLAALILTSSMFSIAASLTFVNNYPFSLGWSEGNRLWDYSILFGRGLYDYPANQEIPVLLDLGRQFVGGLPFMFRGVTIGIVRLWIGLTLVFPYLLLGLAAFRALAKEKKTWALTTLWVFLFLKQGPVHPPLVLSAALTALAWGAPLWFAIPLVAGAGYFAQASRTTWLFAPAIWIVMLEFASASFSEQKNAKTIWTRSIILGAIGIFGGFIFPTYIEPTFQRFFPSPALVAPLPPDAVAPAVPPVVTTTSATPAFLVAIINLLKTQSLLWYRLLPNSTYPNGIIIALALAIAPLLIVLLYFLIKKLWRITRLQKLALLLPLLIFLAIGLVVSAKIGGGGDLHNLDMFLISLTFTGVIAWHNGGREWLQNSGAIPIALKAVIVLMLTFPALSPLREMYSYRFGEDAPWLAKLADAPSAKSLDMLPTKKTTDDALRIIREEVALARQKGEILFIDQRQLLTFGYIDAPLLPAYEKKVLMNEALSANATYFKSFYADLAKRRFSLIISEPLRIPNKDSSFQFSEENNDWVTWVSIPILCYYEPKVALTEVGVQLLAPMPETAPDCPNPLPTGNPP